MVSAGWNDNNQWYVSVIGIHISELNNNPMIDFHSGTKTKVDSSSINDFMDLPILKQHDPRVANIQLFPIFTRSYLRYENLCKFLLD